MLKYNRLWLCCLMAMNGVSNSFTITTFNILAPVHRSMGHSNQRESEREDWWLPRAEAVAKYISDNMVRAD
jgi:hypothetical protein